MSYIANIVDNYCITSVFFDNYLSDHSLRLHFVMILSPKGLIRPQPSLTIVFILLFSLVASIVVVRECVGSGYTGFRISDIFV
jgi:hypothetical protein